MNTATKMKTFVIEEKFVGYADITINAETEEEAILLYNRGYYYRLKEEQPQDVKAYKELYDLINLAGDNFDYRWC